MAGGSKSRYISSLKGEAQEEAQKMAAQGASEAEIRAATGGLPGGGAAGVVGGGTYKVQAGDSWFRIAEEIYGDQRYAEQLAAANGGVSMLHPGMTINTPAFGGGSPAISYDFMVSSAIFEQNEFGKDAFFSQSKIDDLAGQIGGAPIAQSSMESSAIEDAERSEIADALPALTPEEEKLQEKLGAFDDPTGYQPNANNLRGTPTADAGDTPKFFERTFGAGAPPPKFGERTFGRGGTGTNANDINTGTPPLPPGQHEGIGGLFDDIVDTASYLPGVVIDAVATEFADAFESNAQKVADATGGFFDLGAGAGVTPQVEEPEAEPEQPPAQATENGTAYDTSTPEGQAGFAADLYDDLDAAQAEDLIEKGLIGYESTMTEGELVTVNGLVAAGEVLAQELSNGDTIYRSIYSFAGDDLATGAGFGAPDSNFRLTLFTPGEAGLMIFPDSFGNGRRNRGGGGFDGGGGGRNGGGTGQQRYRVRIGY